MKFGNRSVYYPILSIPEKKIGDYEIRHRHVPAGESVPLCTMRNKIIGGQKGPTDVVYNGDTVWHELSYSGGVWMTDLPVEQRQIDETLAPVKNGTVLVGGLGLGYATYVLARRTNISRVIVVEKSSEVIQLVEESLSGILRDQEKKVQVVNQDLFDYLRDMEDLGTQFSWAFYDIWQSDGMGTFFDVVLPLIKMSRGIVRKRPVCWNEDVMRGQLYFQLHGNAVLYTKMTADDGGLEKLEKMAKVLPADNINAKWVNWSAPFYRWVLDTKPDQDEISTRARVYADQYGQEEWRELA